MDHTVMFYASEWIFVLGFVLLAISSVIYSRRVKDKLLLICGSGFALAALGDLFVIYVHHFPVYNQFGDYRDLFTVPNPNLVVGAVLSTIGISVAAVTFFIFSIKKQSNPPLNRTRADSARAG